MRRRLCSFACLTLVAFSGNLLLADSAQAGQAVCVLLSEPGGIYQTEAESRTRGLKRDPADWKITTSALDDYAENGSDLTVAIGTRALETALQHSTKPVLSLLVPRQTYERLAAGHANATALYLDQPLPRQLRLLALALPGMTRAGVPLGPASSGMQAALQSAAKDAGIRVGSTLIENEADLYVALTDLAENSQAFVLLPDPLVLGPGTLRNFFLHTYRLKKPVLAYSAPLVQSGALLGLYTTPAQQGEEAARWISESRGASALRLGPPRYPRLFTVGVNRTVARSLGIVLPREDVLFKELEAVK